MFFQNVFSSGATFSPPLSTFSQSLSKTLSHAVERASEQTIEQVISYRTLPIDGLAGYRESNRIFKIQDVFLIPQPRRESWLSSDCGLQQTNTGNAICTYFQYHQAVTAPWAPPWADTKGTRDVLVSVLLSRACNVCGTDCMSCVRTYDVHNRTNSWVISLTVWIRSSIP